MIDQVHAHLQAWVGDTGFPVEPIFRLIVASIAGGLVGLEREIHGRQAGFRTNLLVCLGSALVMVVSTQFADFPWKAAPGVNINVDPARIAYSVMAGVGFLGAGTIIHNGASIRGLTTAAGLWCVAAVGLAAGFGLYVLSLAAMVLILLTLWLLDRLEDLLPKRRLRRVTLRRAWGVDCILETVRRFKTAGMEVIDVCFERSDALTTVDIHLSIGYKSSKRFYEFQRSIEADPEYQLMAVETA